MGLADVEVWFDEESGLEHEAEWDEKSAASIKECGLFISVIPASTQARRGG